MDFITIFIAAVHFCALLLRQDFIWFYLYPLLWRSL